jgi:formate dehydrogenase iron-sulfur subunit
MHCTDAPCYAVCPKQGLAIVKDSETGFVNINRDECIGCKSCASACPYDIPKFPEQNELPEGDEFPKMYKCWGCLDRQTNGVEPACVKTCPTDCATYGDRDAQVAKAQARKAELEAEGKTAYLYGVDELGGQHYMYVLLKPPSFYGLPTLASLNASSRRTYLRYLKNLGEQYLKKVASF